MSWGEWSGRSVVEEAAAGGGNPCDQHHDHDLDNKDDDQDDHDLDDKDDGEDYDDQQEDDKDDVQGQGEAKAKDIFSGILWQFHKTSIERNTWQLDTFLGRQMGWLREGGH